MTGSTPGELSGVPAGPQCGRGILEVEPAQPPVCETVLPSTEAISVQCREAPDFKSAQSPLPSGKRGKITDFCVGERYRACVAAGQHAGCWALVRTACMDPPACGVEKASLVHICASPWFVLRLSELSALELPDQRSWLCCMALCGSHLGVEAG